MSSQIKKINLLDIKKNSSLVKTNNPFESFIYLQAMENSNSASQKQAGFQNTLVRCMIKR